MSLKRYKVDYWHEMGKRARQEGKSYDSCPLKGGTFSMRGFWESGWKEEDARIREQESPVVGICATCRVEVHERGTHPYKPGSAVRIHTRDDGIVLNPTREFDPVAFAVNTGDDESP